VSAFGVEQLPEQPVTLVVQFVELLAGQGTAIAH
jgi:hypothetical protein